MSRESDGELIGRSLRVPEAFGEIYDRHAPALLRFLVRRAGPDVAEGLLGELFRIAFERRRSFDPAYAEAAPWLYGIASNLLRKHRRSEARRIRACAALADQSPGSTDPSSVPDGVAARSELERVATALAELPDGERDVLLLFAWEDLPYAAIATALEIPVGTVRSRLNRARKRLQEVR